MRSFFDIVLVGGDSVVTHIHFHTSLYHAKRTFYHLSFCVKTAGYDEIYLYLGEKQITRINLKK